MLKFFNFRRILGFKCDAHLFSIYVKLMLAPSCFSHSYVPNPWGLFMYSDLYYDFIDISCFMCSFHQFLEEETEAQRS